MKKASTESFLFKDQGSVAVGDTFAAQRTLHKDELTYRVTGIHKVKKGNEDWFEAKLELLVDQSRNAYVRHPEAIDKLIKKNEGKLDLKTKAHDPSSSDIQHLISEFEREYLGR